jgi:uncharacterized membrane protein
MNRTQQSARVLFAAGVIALGLLGLTVGDFALQWQPVPAWVPARAMLAYLCAALTVASGIGLLVERASAVAARVFFPFLFVWVVLLKAPAVVNAPRVAVNWLGLGEIAVLMTGGWTLFALLSTSKGTGSGPFAGDRGIRAARIVFGLALLPIGVSHFVYARETAAMVPAWLPARVGWAYFTGAGHLAAGLGVLFGVVPRLAAALEAVMLGGFTILVWLPAIVAAPATRLPWTAFIISWVIGAAAYVVAAEIPPASRGR